LHEQHWSNLGRLLSREIPHRQREHRQAEPVVTFRNHPAHVSVVSKFKGENFNKQSLTGVGDTGSMRAALLMVALLALAIVLDAYFYGGFYGQAAARMISQIKVHFL
jgi:hypothetical protein